MERAAPPETPESAERQAQTRIGTRLRASSRPGPDSAARPGGAGLAGRVPGWVLAGVVYAAGAVAVWWQVWSGHPASTMTCACGDPSSFVWYLAWPAYAISHGHSLFFSARVHVPGGMNMLDNTSVLALGVVLAPVTWVFGPVATLNVALTAAPVLTGLSAYGVLRRGLGAGRLAAFAGGLAYGFSPFVLRNEAINHLQASFLALVPLIFWCCYELAVAQRGRWWRWGLALGVLVAVQFFVGTEVLTVTVLTTGIALVLGVVAAWWQGVRNPGGDRVLAARLPFAWRGFAVAVVVGVVLLAYPLWFALAGPGHINGADWSQSSPNSLTSMLLPSFPHNWSIAGYRGPGGAFEGYLGIPALLILAATAVVVRRPLAKLCVAMTLIFVWLPGGLSPHSSRPNVHVSLLSLPWQAFEHFPVLAQIVPANLAVSATWFTIVAGALLADRLLQSSGPATRAAAGAVCLALIVPWLLSWQLPFTTQHVAASSWATSAGSRLPGNSVVLFYPFPATYLDQSLIWQAQSGMRYSIVSGRGIVPGKNNTADHGWTPGTPEGTMSALSTSHVPYAHLAPPAMPSAATVAWFRAALRRWGVTDVVMTPGGRDPDYARRWLTTAIGTAPQAEDGAWVWTNVAQLGG